MNFLERAIAAVSPQWAYQRMAWRSGMSLFDSGSRGRNNTNWNPYSASKDNLSKAERDLIRARAQDLERNSDIACGIISAFERNVVGSGLVLQAKIKDSDSLNEEIESLWKEFCKAEHCDITGTQSLEEMEETVVRRYLVDGGVFIIKVNVEDDLFPFKIQIRSVDELNTTIMTNLGENGNRIIEGVELDAHNRAVAYHFKKYVGTNYTFAPNETVRVPAKDAKFLFRKTSPLQVREVSQLATVLNRIRDANQFIEAVSIKERVLACMSVFIKKALPSGGIGRGTTAAQPEISYDGVKLSPGMIGELNPGDEVQTVIPTGQASNTREFITTLIRMIAAGIGLSYEAVSRDLSQVNYSSARQGLIEDKKTYRKLQKMLVDKMLTPIYMEFLDAAYLTNSLAVPDYMQNRKAYSAHVWIPPGGQWIDPTREVTANKTALETHQDTLARICAERGEDWREVVKQRAAEMKLIKQLMGGEADAEPDSTTDGVDEDAA